MKARLLFIIMATALCLASCDKNRIIDDPTDPSQEGEYLLEIEGLDQTKGVSSVEINLANLTCASSRNITAQLKRRSGSSWVAVTSGVAYFWSSSSADSQKFSGSGTTKQTCTVSAKAEGSGTISVAASISGSQVATKSITVNVADSRELSWTDTVTPIIIGEVKTAVLNSNFTCDATVSSNNGSFLVGLSASSLASSVSVPFSTNTTCTVYYKYTGSSATTIRLNASASAKSASSEIETKSKMLTSLTATYTKNTSVHQYLYNISHYGSSNGSVVVKANYDDGTSENISSSSALMVSITGDLLFSAGSESILVYPTEKTWGGTGSISFSYTSDGITKTTSVSGISYGPIIRSLRFDVQGGIYSKTVSFMNGSKHNFNWQTYDGYSGIMPYVNMGVPSQYNGAGFTVTAINIEKDEKVIFTGHVNQTGGTGTGSINVIYKEQKPYYVYDFCGYYDYDEGYCFFGTYLN